MTYPVAGPTFLGDGKFSLKVSEGGVDKPKGMIIITVFLVGHTAKAHMPRLNEFSQQYANVKIFS